MVSTITKIIVRGRFADADIFAFIGSGVCLKTELVNISVVMWPYTRQPGFEIEVNSGRIFTEQREIANQSDCLKHQDH